METNKLTRARELKNYYSITGDGIASLDPSKLVNNTELRKAVEAISKIVITKPEEVNQPHAE